MDMLGKCTLGYDSPRANLGLHYQASKSLGFPRGIHSRWVVCVHTRLRLERARVVWGEPGVVCPVTYADNWEVWCSRVRPLLDLLDPLAAFLRAACDAKSHFVGLMMTGASVVFCSVLELKT